MLVIYGVGVKRLPKVIQVKYVTEQGIRELADNLFRLFDTLFAFQQVLPEHTNVYWDDHF